MRWVSRFLGTGFFVGYIPIAPATCASAVGAAVYWYLVPESDWVLPLLILGLFALGIWISRELERSWGVDDRKIVIDEICGVLVVFLFIPRSFAILVLGFLLFRVFDVFKPFLIRRCEALKGGLGVMLDDLLSGVYANLTIRVVLLVYQNVKTS